LFALSKLHKPLGGRTPLKPLHSLARATRSVYGTARNLHLLRIRLLTTQLILQEGQYRMSEV